MAPRKHRFWKSMQYRGGRIISAHDKSPWEVGEWREVPAPVRACEGFNCCENIIDAMGYVNIEVLAEVEIEGIRINSVDKITAERMRIIRAWRWTREDTVLLIAYEMKLYIECLEKESLLDTAHSKEQIAAAKALIENPTYENMIAALCALFGGAWNYGAYAGAFYFYANSAGSLVYRSVSARLAFTPKARRSFLWSAHKWVVKHTINLEAF